MLTNAFNKVSAFFKNSETILLARAQVLASLIGAVAVSFDWSPIATGTMPSKQQFVLCGILFCQGLATEAARRRKTIEDDQGYLHNAEPPKGG